MENIKIMTILEDIKSLVKANIEGQKAFEERFERRLSALEKDMAETKSILLAAVKEIGSIKTELAGVKSELAIVKSDLDSVKSSLTALEGKVEQLKEKMTAGNRKNEIWFDLLAREYGRLRLDLDFLKQEFSLISQNA